ncbi:hypothetical protein C8D70_10741 [Chryseobacterium sp. CBTAP 102]|uniref:hypothetical protein n=1 Tax=Chryseobacterium sp. CBTAP 102 TaxID=2135644 RepID=UPI000D97D4DF|nr:hypothetical protein [Chryseobacterium sp. CBTAP 102]PXW14339.1 hypothetical protein C8D70_10741 [Chryseobacterium sp. CBTAP 102]
MRLFLFFTCISLVLLSCQKNQNFEKFTVNKDLPHYDTIQLLTKYPELKLYNSEIVESRTRTACIVQKAFYYEGLLKRSFLFEDYKCKAQYQKDTLNILLNNYNGYFGNGVLVKVFDNRFYIKDIDPKTLKGELKFIKSKISEQKFVLNTNIFKKNDSIYGFVDYKCSIDSLVYKNFRGYFRTKIQ